MRTTRFWNNFHQVTLKAKILESHIIKKISLGGKSKRRNRIAKFCYGHLCLSDECISFKIFQLGIKTYIFHLVLMTRSWTNLDKLFSESQDSKASKAKQQVFGNKYSKRHAQDISKGHAQDISKGHAQDISKGHAQDISKGHAQDISKGHAQDISKGHAQDISKGHAQDISKGHAQDISKGHAQACTGYI